MHIMPLPATPMQSEIEVNVVAAFDPIRDILDNTNDRVHHRVLMFDEIALEKRLQYDENTNKILGICRDNSKDGAPTFSSMEDLRMVFEDIARGDIHIASEVSTVPTINCFFPYIIDLIGNGGSARNSH
jgi:hypothetical protein